MVAITAKKSNGGAHALTNFPHVPGELSAEQRGHLAQVAEWCQSWFVWDPTRGNEDGSSMGKIPINPKTGRNADTSNPGTAAPFKYALDNIPDGGGVGVLVSAARPGFVGIDIDNVIHDGEVHLLGLDAIDHFKGVYIELSPSGAGLRIFCTGELPPDTPKGSTAMGQNHHEKAIKFEMYAAGGKGRFLRTTGATLRHSGGIGPCPDGIAWMSAAMVAAKSKTGGDPSPDKVGLKALGLTLDGVFEALSELRPEVEDPKAIIAGITADTGARPRSKLAGAWRGVLGQFNSDHSDADMYLCSEAVRRGAGHTADVVTVWKASGLSNREKFKRKDYRASTIDAAARSVLQGLQRKAGNAGGADACKSIELPEQLTAAITESGDKLTLSKGKKPEATAGNVVVLFRNDPRIKGLLAFNELAQRSERLGSWAVFDRGASDRAGQITDDDVTRVSMWLASEMGMKMDYRDLMRGIDAAAMDAKYDPLAARLRALGAAWDRVPRVDSWLAKYARIDDTDCREYVGVVGRCFLVGAVARALDPGCQMDTVLAIEGAGGAGKSSLFKVLADSIASGLFTDGVSDVSNPVALVEGTSGRWIVELAELAGIRRAQDVEALKAAITRREDSHRRPYALLPRDYPRRFVFVATTNRTEYLSDPTGALLRRFWPVRTVATESDPIDRAALAAVATQVWAEAANMYLRGVPWHLSESDGQAYDQWRAGRELRREDGAFHDELVTYICSDWIGGFPEGRRLRDIARAVGDMRTVEGDQASRNRLAETLRSLGMESIKRSGLKLWYFTDEAYRRFLELRERTKRDKGDQAAKAATKSGKALSK